MEDGNNQINSYLSWLEVALRAQVVCNKAFFQKFDEIESYVHSKAQGLLKKVDPGDALYQQFEKLKQMLTAVSDKYDISDNFLRRYYGSTK